MVDVLGERLRGAKLVVWLGIAALLILWAIEMPTLEEIRQGPFYETVVDHIR